MRKVEIVSVNISTKKGTSKEPVEYIELTGDGIIQDAHAGKRHRQVSMLSQESIERFAKEAECDFSPGDCAENITVKGMELTYAEPFDRFVNDQLELEVTRIGKKSPEKGSRIYQETGDCVMPEEGIFLRVKKGGTLKKGDQLVYRPKIYKIKIITVSDRAYAGIYEDKSGPRLSQLSGNFFKSASKGCHIDSEIIPDDPDRIEKAVSLAAKEENDIIFTTGGTGIGPRDNTPEVVRSLLDKEIPGIMELIRVKYGMDKPNAVLSRSVAGVSGHSLVYALPGSRKAVEEYATEIFKTVNHSMLMVHGIGDH